MKLFLLVSLLLTNIALAEVRSFGHLLTRNDNYFEDKRCVLSFELTGCRLGPTLIGMSPFLLSHYKLNSVYTRTRLATYDKTTHTLDIGYVNTADKKDLSNEYDMESVMFNYVYGIKLSSTFNLYWNASYFYYSDYRYPFSLLRPDPKVKKHQFNISALIEGRVSEYMLTSTEFGVLQFNGQYPRIQAGTSMEFNYQNFLVKFGISITSTFNGFFVDMFNSKRNDYQQEILSTSDGYYQEFDRAKIKKDFAVHPEINILYAF